MFIDFFFELRRHKVPVATQEWLSLMQGLALGLHDSSLDGFYHLARALCVKDVAHYDAFDAAFLKVFHGIERESLLITEELLGWLADPKQLTDEERQMLQNLRLEELRDLYRKRLEEQRGRHDGGNRWIGTGGTSPFGRGGRHPTGLGMGGGGRSALAVAAERRFREYRRDVILDVRRIDLALRLLRDLGREGAPSELDLDETIDRTAKNAGELDVVMHPPRRNRAKVLLLMDVGGSMDPYAHLVSQLFTAASRTGRFARFRAYYFHNCVYESVYADARFYKPLPVADLLAESDRSEKLVVVGDASMHPAELLEAAGSLYFYTRNATPGIEWMRRLSEFFRKSAWLNPEPEEYWAQTTIQILARLFPMYPLTIQGIDGAVKHLIRGGAWYKS
ncbi:MAG TPA: VWA domain-containing protein [Haliangiales bacterium]|nr:VWA domain-containing protein [Haliangiales bacterium]